MNFYEQQEQALKQTRWLVLLFVLAVIALIFLAAFLFAGIAYVFGLYTGRLESYETGQSLWHIAASVFDWQMLLGISLLVCAVLGLAALFRMWQLKAGGRAIAEQLGGRLINVNPKNSSEKQLLNIVEEMAIASGTPVPAVYLLDESGINAFAAGLKSNDAVIGVTQGALDQLTRHEMQGVIAHEFSHILNGDMRLNLRLIAMIFGITVIAMTGRYFIQGSRRSSRNRSSAVSIGLVLVLLGYLGVFFGNVIKAAISRQREFLADASAVQFTRSQSGIADALKKIGGSMHLAAWQNHNADEVSHMLFSQGLKFHFFSRLMATHPPLATRIKRIEPNWDGNFILEKKLSDRKSTFTSQISSSSLSTLNLAAAIDSAGEISDHQLNSAYQKFNSLEKDFEKLKLRVHDPFTARALVFLMLLDKREKIRQIQWSDLTKQQSPVLIKDIRDIEPPFQQLSADQPVLLLDMALPALQMLSDEQYKDFSQQMLRLIKADKTIEIREWALFNLIQYYCRPPSKDLLKGNVSLRQRKPALARLLSALANLSSSDKQANQKAFNEAIKKRLGFTLRWYSSAELSIQSLSESLQQLRQLRPLEKPRFLKACVEIIQSDGQVEAPELELLRCIAQALDCPLPIIH
jgi:Zn-dependent protease with chaperone function/tellurite resistance protein